MKRWLPRALVVLTTLVCLGAGGYAGQAWWASRLVNKHETDLVRFMLDLHESSISMGEYTPQFATACVCVDQWASLPWYGRWSSTFGWVPSRTTGFHDLQLEVRGLDGIVESQVQE